MAPRRPGRMIRLGRSPAPEGPRRLPLTADEFRGGRPPEAPLDGLSLVPTWALLPVSGEPGWGLFFVPVLCPGQAGNRPGISPGASPGSVRNTRSSITLVVVIPGVMITRRRF